MVRDLDGAGCDDGDIVRIASEGTVTCLPVPTSSEPLADRSMPTWRPFNVAAPRLIGIAGTIDNKNNFYSIGVDASGDNILVVVHLTTNTYTDVLLSGLTLQISDLVFSQATGLLYAAVSGSQLLTIDPTTGSYTLETLPNLFNAGGSWNNVQGDLFFYNKGSGNVVKYNIVTQEVSQVSTGGFVGGGFDATGCIASLEKEIISHPVNVAVAGDTVEYEFRIFNGSNGDCTNGVYTDTLPSGLTWVPSSIQTSGIGAGATISFMGQILTVSNMTIETYAMNGNMPATLNVKFGVPAGTPSSCFPNRAYFVAGSLSLRLDDPTTDQGDAPTTLCVREPFPCRSNELYQSILTVGGDFQMFQVDIESGELMFLFSIGSFNFNSMGINPVDGFIMAVITELVLTARRIGLMLMVT